MLQNSLQNLGSTFQRQREQDAMNAYRQQQLDEEKRRTAVDQAFRDAQMQHYNAMENAASDRATAEQSKVDLANQPHIQAVLKGSDGSNMTFTGTPQQLDAMLAAAKQQGKDITVENKKEFAAQFNVGGAQFSFTDQDAASKFADGMKQKGIDVYNPPAPKVSTTPGGQELVTDGKGHVIKGAPPVMQTQTVRQVPPPIGSTNNAPISLTNTTTRVPAFAAPSAAPAAIAIPVVNSQDDYDALPVGQPYKDSLGRVATKKAPIQNGGGFQIQIPGAMQPGQ